MVAENLEEASDEELARRVLSKDERAAAVLWARHERVLRLRARRRMAGPMRRRVGESDIVQQAYAAAFADLSDFEDRGPGSFRRWLERIVDYTASGEVKRHVRAAKRSARREVTRSTSRPDPDPAGREPTPSSDAILAEERAAMTAGMAELSENDRTVIDLIHRQGANFTEAGRAMGRSAEAARKLYARAVVRLSQRVRRTP